MITEEDIENLRRRVIHEAMSDGDARYWVRRAETFEAARPQPGEFLGNATTADLSERWRRLTEAAQACRARAAVALEERGLAW